MQVETQPSGAAVPMDMDQLVAQYDRFIVSAIYRISRGHVRPDDVSDLKQAVYLRIIEKDYLARTRQLLAERGGAFSTYLFLLVRSVLVNSYRANTRNPLNGAMPMVATAPKKRSLTQTEQLVIETCRDLMDDRFERQAMAAEWMDRFDAHLATLPPRRGDRQLSVVFRAWRQLKESVGDAWATEAAAALGVGPNAVYNAMRKIRMEAQAFASV